MKDESFNYIKLCIENAIDCLNDALTAAAYKNPENVAVHLINAQNELDEIANTFRKDYDPITDPATLEAKGIGQIPTPEVVEPEADETEEPTETEAEE